MIFNTHYDLEGCHAFLGASKYSWLNYDEEHLEEVYRNNLAKKEGTELHELAAILIRKGIKLPRSSKTFNSYVNDAIGFKMTPEQPLYYSDNCFGTADAISFSEKKNLLRIHDLKTGVSKTSMSQLEIYAALFCLEYDVKPNDIQMELRIYQMDDIRIEEPDPRDIMYISNKIISFDNKIEMIREESI